MKLRKMRTWLGQVRGIFAADGWGEIRIGVAAVACAIALLAAATAQAATITVDSTADNNPPDHCTLREAINSALGAIGDTGNCATTSDTTNQIVFEKSLTGTIELTNGRLPEITGGVLTITGPAATPGITIDGDNNQVTHVGSDATLNLANLTITNGSSDDGAIYNDGTLMVTNSTFSDNSANVGGGGIYNDSQATLVVTNSTFFGNRADVNGGMGGAISNRGPLTVTNSTFSDNSATSGGGIYNRRSTLTVTNSTFSDNNATDSGGGIDNEPAATLTVTNSTFSGNSATAGGGIDNEGAASLKSTILAGKPKGGNCGGAQSVGDAGYNLDDDGTCKFASGTTSDSEIALDPNGLQDNGGPTRTIALLPDSVAIDAIPQGDCTYPAGSLNPCSTSAPSNQLVCDQRGMPRPDPLDGPEGNCDIGAYEYQEFAGTPGKANCRGQSVSYLTGQYGSIPEAAAALGYPSVEALHQAIRQFCQG